MCEQAHHEREAQSPLRPGSRALEALGGFDALSCYPSLIFKHSDTKWEKKNIVDQILGGGWAPVAPPLKSATAHTSTRKRMRIHALYTTFSNMAHALSLHLYRIQRLPSSPW